MLIPWIYADSISQTSWDPSRGNSVSIADSKVNDWEIVLPEGIGEVSNFRWGPQVTAPMPLESISYLFSQAKSGKSSSLLPSLANRNGRTFVRKEFFQTKPNNMSPANVTDDVLGFLSLIVSYAKVAAPQVEDESSKLLTPIMPRTDFTTIYNQVKPAIRGPLYNLVKILACYKNIDGSFRSVVFS